MKLWLLSQNVNNGYDTYDTYDSCVVAAENEDKARLIGPCDFNRGMWANNKDEVEVEYIGEAKIETKEGMILASFNAG